MRFVLIVFSIKNYYVEEQLKQCERFILIFVQVGLRQLRVSTVSNNSLYLLPLKQAI
jgi:hypothetical protein